MKNDVTHTIIVLFRINWFKHHLVVHRPMRHPHKKPLDSKLSVDNSSRLGGGEDLKMDGEEKVSVATQTERCHHMPAELVPGAEERSAVTAASKVWSSLVMLSTGIPKD